MNIKITDKETSKLVDEILEYGFIVKKGKHIKVFNKNNEFMFILSVTPGDRRSMYKGRSQFNRAKRGIKSIGVQRFNYNEERL
jgi:hypothetical protein